MGHFIRNLSGGMLIFFYFSLQARCAQHHEVGHRSADENLMFEGIGSNSQQVERSELSGHRHCLPICENRVESPFYGTRDMDNR